MHIWVCRNVFWDCVDCVQDVLSGEKGEKYYQTPVYASRILNRATEEMNDVTVCIVHGLKQGKLCVRIWNSHTLPQTKQWPLQSCCLLISRWPRAKSNFQCNMALPALTATKQYCNGASARYQNWQKGHNVGKELHDFLSSIQSIWNNVNTERTVQHTRWAKKARETIVQRTVKLTWPKTAWILLRMVKSRTLIVLS